MKYLKTEGREVLFATVQIPINSFQIYGFSRLEGKASLPLNIDYSQVFQKTQLITHIDGQEINLELLNYGPNYYEFSTSNYH
jgi:hypothetical protein